MKVLLTTDGTPSTKVVEGQCPPFNTHPEVIFYGTRVFRPADQQLGDGVDRPLVYVEAFGVALVVHDGPGGLSVDAGAATRPDAGAGTTAGENGAPQVNTERETKADEGQAATDQTSGADTSAAPAGENTSQPAGEGKDSVEGGDD